MTPTRAGRLTAALLAVGLAMTGGAYAQSASSERQLVLRAAEALGGAERIQSLRTMRLRGYGHEAYQDGGSEITTEPAAPEKMTNLTAYERSSISRTTALESRRGFRARSSSRPAP
jgi:hypothetical protein